MTSKYRVLEYIDSLLIQTNTQKPSEWAEQNRIVTTGSNHKGRWSYDLTPYMREIVDRLSPQDPARVISLMAGSQLGKSHGFIFNGIGYVIANRPTNMLLTCGDDDLTRDSMQKIDDVIFNSGIKHLIRPNIQKKNNQKSGDTDRIKEFNKGILIAQSIKAPDKIKQNSFEIIFLDDIESAGRSNTKNVGDIVDLAFARSTSYNDTYKICLVGVPELKHTSIIEPNYLKGDQRHYLLPCPLCGEYIQIIWYEKIEGENKEHAGIVFETDDSGRLIEKSVGYICQKCHGFFKESHKQEMLMQGKWVPSAIPKIPNWLSYHLPALLAPRGFFTWTHYAHRWLEIFPSHGVVLTKKLQHFKNHVLAETYEEKGKSIKINKLAQNTRSYKIGTVPMKLSEEDGNGRIIILTCACDLNGMADDGRIDYEIVAHSETGCTYSIDAGNIGTFQRGGTQENRETWTYRNNEIKNNLWTSLKEILQRDYVCDNGRVLQIAAVGIDTSYFTNFAYAFIDANQFEPVPLMLVGLKGDVNKVRKMVADTDTFKQSNERNNLYILEVNQLKDIIADRVDMTWNEGDGLAQPPGFMNFPQPSDGKYSYKNYFLHFEAEEKKPKLNADGSELGYVWKKKNNTVANHFFDCAVYQPAIRDIFVESFLKSIKIKDISWGKFCEIIKNVK